MLSANSRDPLPHRLLGYWCCVQTSLLGGRMGGGLQFYLNILASDGRKEVTNISPISIEEYIEAPASDAWCHVIAGKVDGGIEDQFKRDERGLLLRAAPLDLAHQVLVPNALHPRLLHLSRHSRLVDHPETVRMYHVVQWILGRPKSPPS